MSSPLEQRLDALEAKTIFLDGQMDSIQSRFGRRMAAVQESLERLEELMAKVDMIEDHTLSRLLQLDTRILDLTRHVKDNFATQSCPHPTIGASYSSS